MQVNKPIQLRCQVDTGAEGNVVGSAWVPMLQLAGAELTQQTPTDIGWVSDATFTVTASLEVSIQVTGTKHSRVMKFLVAPDHINLDGLVVGWPEVQEWGLLADLDRIMVVQREMGLLAITEPGDGNQRFRGLDGEPVETDDLLWVEDNVAEAGELPKVGEVLPVEEAAEVRRLVEEFQDVFSRKLQDGGASVEPMQIQMTPEWDADKLQPFRKYAPAVAAAMGMELEAQLAAGIVEPSQALSGAPVHMVRKDNSASGYRFCVDFTETNKHVVCKPYPLPTVQTILDSFGGSKFFGKLDLRQGYWQFPVRAEDRPKLAFQMQGRVYQYRVVAMGHVQSSYHVQRVMHNIFFHVIGKGVFIYLDDIVIHAKTFTEFVYLLREVLSLLRKHQLRCKGEKCEIGLAAVMVLGHIVSADGIRMGDDRKAAALAMPFPRSTRELRRFLGYTGYMRRHVFKYSELAKPLSAQQNTPVGAWPRDEMVRAFHILQEAVQSQISLAHLDYALPIVVSADASILGVGGCLANRYRDEQGDEVTRVVACASHAFTEAESRWKTIEQEAFALVWIVMHFRAVLWGQPFVLETDHRNLTYIHGGTSPKVMRWAMALQNFSFSLVHVPGAEQLVADALSRAPVARMDNTEAVQLDDFVPAPEMRRLGVLRVVDDEHRRRALFDSCHNSTQGHHGVQRTVNEIRALEYDWPRLSRDVTRWIHECPQCQKIRAPEPSVAAVDSPIGAFCIFEELSVDFVGPLPTDEVGNSYIFNAVCSTTRYCELFAVEAATAIVAAHCILAIVSRYGCFRRLRSDRGSHFVNDVISEFLRLFEIQSILTLAQRPQANALVERNSGEVARHLRAVVLDKVIRPLWSVMLPLIMRIINRSFKPSVGSTPHRLLHWAPTDLDRGMFAPFRMDSVVPPLHSSFVRTLEQTYEHLLDVTSDHVRREQDRIQLRFDGMVPTEFKVGSYVLVSYLARPPSKLHCRWDGPFEVVSRDRNTVIVRDLTNDARHEFDVSRLRHFLVAPGVDVKAVAASDMGEAEVRDVLDHRGSAKKRADLEFQVRWSDGDITWETWDHVKKLAEVDAYIRAHPEAKLKALLSPV